MSSAEAPQIAWKALEPGADVVSAEGESVGKVTRAVGDADADVFTGFAVKLGTLGRERLIPSERVTGIWPDRITTDLSRDRIESLPEYKDVEAVRFEPGFSSIFRRLFGRG